MLGAIAGDIIGSVYENLRTKRKDFPLFTALSTYTDDTVLTVAVAEAILTGQDYGRLIKAYARRHPLRGYGPGFLRWMATPVSRPYHSYGNGSAMRVSPVGFAFEDEDQTLAQAARSAACTHDHPDGIRGAQAVALAVFLARQGQSKEAIRETITARFHYDLDRSIDQIRPHYRFSMTCPGSVPEAIIAFLDATSFEDAVRNAVSLGGDSDTQACIAGAIAEAHFGPIPEPIRQATWRRLPAPFRDAVARFERTFPGDGARATVSPLRSDPNP